MEMKDTLEPQGLVEEDGCQVEGIDLQTVDRQIQGMQPSIIRARGENDVIGPSPDSTDR
jgi:hypothetical protein